MRQSSFEDLGTPLSEVTFCVVDLETTGGSPHDDAITEVGALKVRCGDVQGTFQTLVDPGRPVPAFVRLLTGITDDLLSGAPRVSAVLPSFLEFARNTVLVAHNARFDVSFLNAALGAHGYEPLSQRVVDTAGIARKVLAGEVPDRKLDTLARHFRCAHQPAHRAFPDVLATVDVLHALIERLTGFGVTTLDDLCAISFTKLDGTFAKITLAAGLPRGPGVYRFAGAAGQTLYVGKATDIRGRVRSYFYGDVRRRMRDLLRETQSVSVEPHATMLEAEVAEARAIAAERPPYNRAGKRGGTWYFKVVTTGRRPRAAAARTARADGGVYLGPFTSYRVVRDLVHHTRRSTPAELAAALTSDPSCVFDALDARLARLAREERFEEAAELRRSAEVLERALWRRTQVAALAASGDVVVALDGRALLIRSGRLAGAARLGPCSERETVTRLTANAQARSETGAGTPSTADGRGRGPVPQHDLPPEREAGLIARWLDRNSGEVRLLHASEPWALPIAFRPSHRFAVRDSRRSP